jgi:hypothetical protein
MTKGSAQKTRFKSQSAEPEKVVQLAPDVKAKIGKQLRSLYDEVIQEGVPDRFLAILKALDDPRSEGGQ